MKLSVAIPLYNEETLLEELLARLDAVLDGIEGGPHEIVIANDGSTDRTTEMLAEAAADNPRLVVVDLARNFGHQAALSAALDHATGDAVVMMDGDLQDRPEVIPDFLAHHLQGYDVVFAKRVRRKESLLLRASYFLFYRLAAWLSNVRLPLDAGDFCLVSRRVAEVMRQMPEPHRYLRGMRTWVGFRQIGIDVERDARSAGKTKYTGARLFRLAFDGIFSFSIAPLRATTLLGLVAVSLSIVYAVYAVIVRLFFDWSPQGFTAIIVVMVFLFGIQFLILGVLGEYVGRTYEQGKHRPNYVISRVTRTASGERG